MIHNKHPQSKISNRSTERSLRSRSVPQESPQSKIGSQDANMTRKLKFSR